MRVKSSSRKRRESVALTAATFSAAILMNPLVVHAQAEADAQTPTPATTEQRLDTVEVTGTLIKRVDAEGSLPVQIVSRQEIERAGYQSVEQVLAALSATSSIGGTQLSTGAGTSTFGVSTVSMRGLGDNRTLVLVNGRRLAAQAGNDGSVVNINTIPLAAIERVEVLKDGASSVYGSDAVAGVVNFILKKDFTGLEAAATFGQPTRSGGGKNTRLSLTGGVVEGRFSFTGSASLEKETALYGRDRDFAKNGTVLPYFVSGATGQGNIEGAYTPGDGSTPYTSAQESARRQAGFGGSPGTGYGNPLAASDNCAAIRMFLNPTPTSKGAPFCAYDSAPDVGLVPDRDLKSLTGNFSFKLNDNHELFGDALWAQSEVTQSIQPSPARRSFFTPSDTRFNETGTDPVLLVRPGNAAYDNIAVPYLQAMSAAWDPANGADPYAPLIGQPLAVTARVFDFGPRTSDDKSTQLRVVLGSRGMLPFADLGYEAAYAHNQSELKGTVTSGYFSQQRFASVVNQPDSDYNPWSLQQSATFVQRLADSGAVYAGPTLNAKTSTDQLDGMIRGTVTQLPAGALQFASGLQLRKESYTNNPSPALESGDIAGLGGATPAVDRKRDASALFGEINVPIIETLEAGAGLRYDRYDDVGNATTYKANLSWRPLAPLLVRASTGSGFRAPSMIELYQPQVIGTSEQFNDDGPGGTGQTDIQVPALSGGNPNLKPEKSRQNSVGVVFQATSAFSAGMDLWWIKIKDSIIAPSAQLVVSRFRAGDPAYQNDVTLNGNDIDQITTLLSNTGSLDISGVDIGLSYKEAIGPGKLALTLDGTYMTRFDETTPSGEVSSKVGTNVDFTGAPVIGADGGGVSLRWKHIATASWTQGVWAFTAVQNFYKGYEMGHDLNDARRFVPSQALYDASVSFTGVPQATIGLGVRNIFDTDPPIYIPSSNQFQSGYDAAMEDPRRRYVYVSGSYKFF